jgi:hypothetical protein
VDQPTSLSLDELRQIGATGSSRVRVLGQPAPLRACPATDADRRPAPHGARKAGVKDQAREFVFLPTTARRMDFRETTSKWSRISAEPVTKRAVGRSVPGLRVERRAVTRHQGRHSADSGIRRGQREMALSDPRPGGTASGSSARWYAP